MFKAKIINDPAYYRLKRNVSSLALIGVLAGFIVFADKFLPLWLILSIVLFFTLWLIYNILYWKTMQKRMGGKVLELKDNQLRLLSPAQGDAVTFDASQLDGIIFKEEYKMQPATFREIIKGIGGQYQKNYLIVQQGNTSQRYDFELDSYYMITQLEKVIKDWTAKGFPVRRVES